MSESIMPHPGFSEPTVVARALGVLLAAGAYDVAPTEIPCPSFKHATVYVIYNEDAGAVNGAVNLRVDYSPFAVDGVLTENWYQETAKDTGGVVANADTQSNIQRELLAYGAVGTNNENFVFQIQLNHGVERIRIAAAEVGDVANPGTCEILIVFSE